MAYRNKIKKGVDASAWELPKTIDRKFESHLDRATRKVEKAVDELRWLNHSSVIKEAASEILTYSIREFAYLGFQEEHDARYLNIHLPLGSHDGDTASFSVNLPSEVETYAIRSKFNRKKTPEDILALIDVFKKCVKILEKGYADAKEMQEKRKNI